MVENAILPYVTFPLPSSAIGRPVSARFRSVLSGSWTQTLLMLCRKGVWNRLDDFRSPDKNAVSRRG